MGSMEENMAPGARVVRMHRVRIDGTWQCVPLPRGSRIVYVENPLVVRPPAAGNQYRSLYFWAESPAGAEDDWPVMFRAFITNETIPDPTAV